MAHRLKMATKTLRGLSSVMVALAVAVVLVALHGPASFAAADSQSYVPVVLMHVRFPPVLYCFLRPDRVDVNMMNFFV